MYDTEDLSTLDRGNDIPETAEVPAKEPEETVEEVVEELTKEEPARDEHGRFSKKDDEDEPRIPKSRFDDAIGKERAAREQERSAREVAERKLAEIEAQTKQITRTEDTEKLEAAIKALEKQHAKLLLDGESDKAAEVMGQIRLSERQIAIAEATHMTNAAKDQAREEMRLELAVERLEADYDVLNPAHENYDKGLVRLILGEQRMIMESERLSPSRALLAAVKEVMNRFGQAQTKAQDAKGLAAEKPAAGRKEAQVAKNIEAAKKQPASLKDTGLDSDKGGQKAEVDPAKLTFEEFSALPDSTKAKLRGDFA